MTPCQRGRVAWEVREAEVRIAMLDASIRAHQVAGEHDLAARLMRVRRLVARKAALMDFQSLRPSVQPGGEIGAEANAV